ncbi:hypothetical protein [uncultured Jannaschia sp.]|uniref:hypothetical protein n=1 Tax=uncultured Jannaschia sp. TaxID=293347 RepID=UPI00261F37DD|nr:hypothetical protein [uncultured Jannaschia sp.]
MCSRLLRAGLLVGALSFGVAAQAQTASGMIGRLQAEGFDRIEVSRTLLGRVRIEARGNGQRREIVFNPRTGEVLRDYARADDDSDDDRRDRGRGRGRDDRDDRDDDDDDNDDDDDDDGGSGNSGSGSSNSGSGSGGGGDNDE